MIMQNLVTNQLLLGFLIWLVLWSDRPATRLNQLTPSALRRISHQSRREAMVLVTVTILGNVGLGYLLIGQVEPSFPTLLNAMALALSACVALLIRCLRLLAGYAWFTRAAAFRFDTQSQNDRRVPHPTGIETTPSNAP